LLLLLTLTRSDARDGCKESVGLPGIKDSDLGPGRERLTLRLNFKKGYMHRRIGIMVAEKR
jgi:hypothetical protein